MAYIVVAYTVMVHTVMAYIVMAYIVMATFIQGFERMLHLPHAFCCSPV